MRSISSIPRFHYFAGGCFSTICWTDYLCSVILLCSFVKYQLTIFMWIYFWALYSLSMIYLSILLPIPHSLDYCRFTVSLEFGQCQCQSSNFVLLFQYCVGYSGTIYLNVYFIYLNRLVSYYILLISFHIIWRSFSQIFSNDLKIPHYGYTIIYLNNL